MINYQRVDIMLTQLPSPQINRKRRSSGVGYALFFGYCIHYGHLWSLCHNHDPKQWLATRRWCRGLTRSQNDFFRWRGSTPMSFIGTYHRMIQEQSLLIWEFPEMGGNILKSLKWMVSLLENPMNG